MQNQIEIPSNFIWLTFTLDYTLNSTPWEDMYAMYYALTQPIWVLFCVLSTGSPISLMSYTCFKPYRSNHIQPNGLQNEAYV